MPAILSTLGLRAGLVLAAALAVLAVLAGARNAGRQVERVDQLKRTLEIKHGQDQARVRAPRGRAAVAGSLRDGTF